MKDYVIIFFNGQSKSVGYETANNPQEAVSKFRETDFRANKDTEIVCVGEVVGNWK